MGSGLAKMDRMQKWPVAPFTNSVFNPKPDRQNLSEASENLQIVVREQSGLVALRDLAGFERHH